MEAQLTQLQVTRQDVFKTLQKVIGVVKEKQTMPILANVHLSIKDNIMSITGTDSEVELKGETNLINSAAITNLEMTLPGRKLSDICRALPEHAAIELYHEDSRVILRSGKSRFTLTTLPPCDFPNIEQGEIECSFTLPQNHLRELLQQTSAFMAQQDVRYYLNGLLLTKTDNELISVATDGHRLAKSSVSLREPGSDACSVIVPRKGVLELMRLLADSPDPVTVSIGGSHISVQHTDFSFVSRLIEGAFPDFKRVIPSSASFNTQVDRDLLKDALQRVMILCSDKYKAIRFEFRQDSLRILANNPQQESAEDSLEISYQGPDQDIGFNIRYLLDMLNTIPPGPLKMLFNDADQSVLFETMGSQTEGNAAPQTLFVVMPMRL